MIRWIIVLLGVSAGSSLTEANNPPGSIKNDTKDSYLPQFDSSSSGFKPKRQLDDFEFDSSSFDTSSVFPIKKINGLTAFDDEDTSDFSAAISAPSYKVTRSNSDSLGVHNQGGQQENYSNENPPSVAYNGQAASTFYKPAVQQSKYVETNNLLHNHPAYVPYYSYPATTEYTFSIPIYNLKQHPIPSSYLQTQAATQNNPYKTAFDQGINNFQPNAKVYAPTHRHNPQQQQPFQAHFQNFAQNPFDIQYTTASTAEINNKKLSLPVVQLQAAQNGYVQGLEAMPVIFSAESGLQYKSEPAIGASFDYAKNKNSNQRSGYSAPFLNQPTLGPIQVVPLQAASSTASFPKYKGASVAQVPQKPFSKIPNDYQEFKTQTQLHFGGNNNNNNNNKQEGIYKPANAKPFERIRTDVEVIDKKKPIPPLPKNDDDDEANHDDESGEGYQSKDSYLPQNEEDDVDSRKYFKESELEGDFKPSKSYPFKEYEEKYSKPSKKASKDDDDEEENFDTDVDLAAKYRYLSKSEDDDDDEENESAEDKPRSKYKSYPIEESYKNYNEDDDDDDDKEEEETKKLERKEKAFDFEHEYPSSRREKSRKERRKAVEDEATQPTKKKQSKPKHSQTRSKSSSEFSSRPRPRANFQRHETTERNSKRERRRPYRDETGEPLNRAPKFSRNFSPEAHFEGSTISPFKFTSARSPSSTEDAYRLSKGVDDFHLDDGGQSTFSKEEAAVTDSYGNPRKSTTSSSPQTARSPKTAGDQRPGRKSPGVKTKPIVVDSYNKPVSSGLRALVQAKPSYFASDLNRDILRRLKGV